MAARTGVRFELERLALAGDELVITGFWTGAEGMRFVRPTLLADDRRILATLEHKPWAPSNGAPWTAAFPWTGGVAVDADSLALVVAPKVIVPLGETATRAPAVAEAAPGPDSARARQPAVATESAVAAKPAPATAAAQAAVPAPAANSSKAPPRAKPKPAPAAKPTSATVAKPKPAPRAKPKPATASKRKPAPRAKPTPVADPASNGASAATPSVVALDERADDLARALAATERERDRALAQRDEALIAYRTLQRQLQAERAQTDRAAHDRQDGDAETDPQEPLGVRTVPAVRSVMAELQYPPREPKRRLAKFDLWVVRVIGLAAAGCFLALLISILRVFI